MFHEQIRDHLRAVESLTSQVPLLEQIAAELIRCLRSGHTIYLCGNGGSAADCQHVAGEFVGRFLRERAPWPAVALTTDTSVLTAIGNDYGYDQVFARQVTALAKPGDIVAGISTSGKSPNVLAALRAAKANGAATLAFTGEAGGIIADESTLAFKAPSKHTPRVQEVHLLAWHLLCDRVEEELSRG
jgi:D-sedoheptulose 7-phosphate isomerase